MIPGTKQSIVSMLDITELKRSQKIQNIIYNISNAVLTTTKLKELIHIIRSELGKVIDTTNFFVALYDEKTDTFQLPYYHDEIDNVKSFPASKTITRYVIETQKPLLATLEDLKELERAGKIELQGTDSHIWLGVPLKVKTKVIGAMVVQNYTDEKMYTHSDMELLEIISLHVGLAIQRKRAEEELMKAKERAEESEDEFRRLYENALVALFRIRISNGKLITANKAAADLFGYPSVKEFQKEFTQEKHLVNPADIKTIIEELKKKGFIDKVIMHSKKKDGTLIYNEASFKLNLNKDYVDCVSINITKRKQVEETLLIAKERLHYLVANNPAVLFSHKAFDDFGTTFMSENVMLLLGYEACEFMQDSNFWTNRIHPDDVQRVNDNLSYLFEKGDHIHEYRFLHKDGKYKWMRDEVRLVKDVQGKPFEIVGFWIDITERKWAEEELMKAKEKAEENEFQLRELNATKDKLFFNYCP